MLCLRFFAVLFPHFFFWISEKKHFFKLITLNIFNSFQLLLFFFFKNNKFFTLNTCVLLFRCCGTKTYRCIPVLDLANASLANEDDPGWWLPPVVNCCGCGCGVNPKREAKTSSSDALLRERSGAE